MDGSEADGDHVLIQKKGGISYIPWRTCLLASKNICVDCLAIVRLVNS